jgi:hypothetical protein
MGTFTFVEPSNDFIEAPTAEQVVALMRQDGDYWGPYSPVGQLLWDEPGRCQLFFVRHPRRGWYIEFDASWDTSAGPKQHLVAVDPSGDRGAWVEHWAEGDTSYFLAACFVSQEIAERVVTDFLATRQPSPAASWEPVDWRVHKREGPPDDESAVVESADPER